MDIFLQQKINHKFDFRKGQFRWNSILKRKPASKMGSLPDQTRHLWMAGLRDIVSFVTNLGSP